MGSDSFALAVTLGVVVATFTVLALQMLGVSMERPYYDEYQACQAELKTATTPACAPCECHQGWLGIVWATIGGLVMIGSYVLLFHNNRKMEQVTAEARKEARKTIEAAEKKATMIIAEAQNRRRKR